MRFNDGCRNHALFRGRYVLPWQRRPGTRGGPKHGTDAAVHVVARGVGVRYGHQVRAAVLGHAAL